MKRNNKGFTLMEMLIVVAIIAILVAIAIPTFSGALTKAKEAADVANVRAEYAEVVVANLTAGTAFDADYAGQTLNYPENLTWTVVATVLTVDYDGTTTDLATLTAESVTNPVG